MGRHGRPVEAFAVPGTPVGEGVVASQVLEYVKESVGRNMPEGEVLGMEFVGTSALVG